MGTFKYLGYFKETNYEVYLASKLGDSIENIISTEGKKKTSILFLQIFLGKPNTNLEIC